MFQIRPEHYSEEQRAALRRHGYRDDAAPRGVAGPARFAFYSERDEMWVRNRVCYLDGIKIDGHETSDLDSCVCCIHCDYECPECRGVER